MTIRGIAVTGHGFGGGLLVVSEAGLDLVRQCWNEMRLWKALRTKRIVGSSGMDLEERGSTERVLEERQFQTGLFVFFLHGRYMSAGLKTGRHGEDGPSTALLTLEMMMMTVESIGIQHNHNGLSSPIFRLRRAQAGNRRPMQQKHVAA